MQHLQSVALVCLAPLVATPGLAQQDPQAELQALSAAEQEFAFELLRKLQAEESGNLVCSPYGLYGALLAAQAGARGETALRLAATLELEGWSAERILAAAGLLKRELVPGKRNFDGTDLSVADAIWARRGETFVPQTLEALEQQLGSGLFEFDYANGGEDARHAINAWAEQHTGGLVPELLKKGAIQQETRLLITNAIHFQGNWEHDFDKDQTTDLDFHLSSEESVAVPFLRNKRVYSYAQVEGARIVRLTLGLGRFQVAVVVPDAQDGLADLVAGLDAATWSAWRGAMGAARVDLALPKVELRSPLELQSALARMDLSILFGRSADLSGFAGRPGELWVDGVIQEAVLKLDEKGVEAAAATAIRMRALGAMPSDQEVTLTVDHPYLLVLEDSTTGAILFVAQVADPR